MGESIVVVGIRCAQQALFGDRYGNAATLRSISEAQFHIFEDTAAMMKVKNAELLQEWYEFDTNAVPACYSLKASACCFTNICLHIVGNMAHRRPHIVILL